MCFRKNIKRVLKRVEYLLHLEKLIRLGHLEMYIALSNLNIDVRIRAQRFCVAIVSLSFL